MVFQSPHFQICYIPNLLIICSFRTEKATSEKGQKTLRYASRKQIAAEVIELGEMLFDAALDTAMRRPDESEEIDGSLIEDMRVAAEDFFTALRLLLEAEQETVGLNEARS
jgi:hypothetical protein